MPGDFWTNTVWYVLLLAAGAGLYVPAFVRAGNKRFFGAFTLAVIGLFYLFEFVLVATGAYSYYPKIFTWDPYMETYIGNVFSQVSIAAATMFLISFRLKWYWNILFAAAYYFIMIGFEALGVFTTYWYRNIYTPVILVFLFWLLRRWYGVAATRCGKTNEVSIHFLAATSMTSNLLSLPMAVLGLRLFSGEFFRDPYMDHTTVSVLYTSALLAALIGIYRSPKGRAAKALMVAGLVAVQYAVWLAGLIVVPAGTFLWVTAVQFGAKIYFVCLAGWMLKAQVPEKAL